MVGCWGLEAPTVAAYFDISSTFGDGRVGNYLALRRAILNTWALRHQAFLALSGLSSTILEMFGWFLQDDLEAQAQIQQMVKFILNEAKDKAQEIEARALEDFNIEKLKLVQQMKDKIRHEFDKKAKQLEVQRSMYVWGRSGLSTPCNSFCLCSAHFPVWFLCMNIATAQRPLTGLAFAESPRRSKWSMKYMCSHKSSSQH